MRKKCLPQPFVWISTGNIFRHENGDGEIKPDGEFTVAIPDHDLQISQITLSFVHMIIHLNICGNKPSNSGHVWIRL
jgi:hypothetical protein